MTSTDAITGATIRQPGATKLGEGHTTLQLTGIATQDAANTVGQAIFDVPGVIAVKVFPDGEKAMYDVDRATDPSAVKAAVKAAGAQVVD